MNVNVVMEVVKMLRIITGKKEEIEKYGNIKFPEAGTEPMKLLELAKNIVKSISILHSCGIDVEIITYSAIFIEAIDTFAEYYYHLYNKNLAEYILIKDKKETIPDSELYKVYNFIGDAYDEIDVLRLMAQMED